MHSLFLQHQELGGGVLRKLELQQVGVPGLPQPLKGQLLGGAMWTQELGRA